MHRADVVELHFITPTVNVPSIMERGILCNRLMSRLTHQSLADEAVQSRRASRKIPGGLPLHSYVNLYFNARNAMLYRILKNYDGDVGVDPATVVILRVDDTILDLEGVVITDINAASDTEPRWHTVEEGIAALDKAAVYRTSWRHADVWEKTRRKQRMMAETLVPHRIETDYITGAYVVSQSAAAELSRMAPTLATEVNTHMFFKEQS